MAETQPMALRDDYPVKLKRDMRVAAPQPVYRAVADVLEQEGFRVFDEQPPTLTNAALPGTATFRARLLAVRDFSVSVGSREGVWLLAAAALMVVAVVVLIIIGITDRFVISALMLPAIVLGGLGLGRMQQQQQMTRHLIEVRMEGESYSAGASRSAAPSAGDDARVERSGVVSDLRITILAGAGEASGDRDVKAFTKKSEDTVFKPAERTVARVSDAPLAAVQATRVDLAMDRAMDRFALTEGKR
ncbi:MAG: hypothetical protein FJ318_04580 [SAR202 cluster bacterium]|nr:hypothetical protein [SAR202 cluster bacterium]